MRCQDLIEKEIEMKGYPKFLPSVEWKAPADINHYGYFSRARGTIAWESCRERFQISMSDPKVKSILYSFDESQNRYGLAAFLHKTETILGLKRKSTYNEVYKKDGLYYRRVLRINIARFWKSEYIRSSFFTALLRVGAGHTSAGHCNFAQYPPYDPETNNYEECLFKNPNMALTKTAVKRFLCGFTHYTGPHPHPNGGNGLQNVGWMNLLADAGGNNAGKGWQLLVKPKNDNKNIIAAGKFWG